MLNIFTLANGRLVQEEIESLEELSKFQPIWVDLESPTVEEKRWIKQYYGLSIPEDAMDEDIEESARFYEEDDGNLHIRSDFLIADADEPRAVRVAFILHHVGAIEHGPGILFSIHDEDLPVFRLLRLRARRVPGLLEDAKEVLLKLFDADAEYCADTLESIYDHLEKVSSKVLAANVTDDTAGEVLSAIARHEDLNGRIRRNMMDTRRAVSFLMRRRLLNADQFEDVVKILMPIAPRLYSVSSSPAAHGENEIHITVAKNAFLSQDEQRYGLCSEFLGDLPVGSPITFYVHKDKNFKLPAADKDVIMIGPGTGVAPFRSFLAERDATGASGRNWFFFGEQHFTTDFLYQTEMQNYVETGVLTKIDLAFSRDQQEKIYVQHRIKEKAGEFFQWIDGGASVYISGTKDPMSKDVEHTLLQIIEEHESTRRGIYGGAIGYIDFTGNIDTCIAIRTAVLYDGKAYVQAGAGIVADSDAESENQECHNKAAAVLGAIHAANSLASRR